MSFEYLFQLTLNIASTSLVYIIVSKLVLLRTSKILSLKLRSFFAICLTLRTLTVTLLRYVSSSSSLIDLEKQLHTIFLTGSKRAALNPVVIFSSSLTFS